MKTYEDLNNLSIEELENLKKAEHERIAKQESYRQSLIVDILCLQNITDLHDMRTPKVSNENT